MILRSIAAAAIAILGIDAHAAQTELTGVTQISAGSYRTCALTNAGAVKCWGAGYLGDGSTASRNLAVQVTGLESGVIAIGVGGARGANPTFPPSGQGHACAVMGTGGIKCWGENTKGQLGDGTTTWRTTPVDVLNLPGPATAVSPGAAHTCALLASGGVYCWGDNSLGQLGGNALTSGIVSIAGKGNHSCAVTSGGGAKCWGANSSGQLGDGTTTNQFAPVDVQSLTSGVASISPAGILESVLPLDGSFTCAVTTQGAAKCWGAYANGALGDPSSTSSHLTPFDVSGLTSGVAAVSTGSYSLLSRNGCCGTNGVSYGLSIALTTSGGVKSWGTNLSDGNRSAQPVPQDVAGLTSGVTAVAAGGLFGCALLTGGTVTCGVGGAPQLVFEGTLPQLITFTGTYPRIPVGASHTLNATGGASGNPVVFTSLEPTICSVSGNIATGLAQGMCRIGANQAGNASWDPAPEANLQFVVGQPLAQSITFGPAPTVPVNGVGSLNATASSGLTVTYVSNSPSICAVSGSFVMGVALGSCTVAASQAGNDFYLSAPQVTQTFPVTANTGTTMLRVTRGGTGVGTVTSAPTGINCGAECGGNFTSGSTVTLSPAAGTDSFFDRWEGACTGTGACSVSMTATRDVTAHFQSTIPRLANISTRANVQNGADVMIAGFIIQGSGPKTVVVRARGPSLAAHGITNYLPDPQLQLFSASTEIGFNGNYGTAPNAAALVASGFAPADPTEPAILTTLLPGAYSAIVRFQSFTPTNVTGIAIVEVFELDAVTVPLVNISTRARVQTGDNVMIAGFIIQGQGPQTVVVRARGPSLTAQGVPDVLANPTMQLYSGQTQIATNDDWVTSPDAAQIQASGFAPLDDAESAIMMTLQPGAYSAIVSGVGGTTGVGLVEVFRVP